MKQQTKYLLAAGGVTALIFTTYKALAKITPDTPINPANPDSPSQLTGVGTESPYIAKVKALQTALGVTPVSGWAGPITNAAVSKAYPELSKKLGAVSEANIDEYLKAKPETPPKVNDRVQQLWDAMGDGTPATLRIESKLGAYYLDKAGNQWKPTGGAFVVPAKTKIYKSKAYLMTNGFIATVTVKDGSVKNIFFPVTNLYVA